MEAVLLVVLIVVFIVLINSLSKKIDRLQESFFEISSKLDHYKKLAEAGSKADASPQQPKEQPQEFKNASPVTPSPPAPIVTEKPVTPIYTPPKPVEPVSIDALPRTATFEKPAPAPQPHAQLPPKRSLWKNFKEQNPDLEKFIGENLINKIGILILVLGISYFVKFAIDKDWINEPARVGIGILAGSIVMLVAHKLRINYKAFSSVLVAGAISIFYFTITVAFHDYGLFSQTVAFIIMVAITGFSAFISVNYNRIELAALSLVGGFAAPFMVSTGSGNFAVLFTYIAILNIGILSIAYYKKWNFINAQAYIFTVILFGGWLLTIEDLKNPPYAGALLFAFVFYLIFIVMNIINNIRTKAAFSTMQLLILVSNTFLFYGAGMYAIDNIMPQYKGLFTLLLGLFNFSFAWLLYKKLAMDQKIIYVLIGLTLTFVTLTVPIQFNGNHITLFWAAEAVLLLWLAQKSKIESFRLGSVIVQSLMLISLLIDWVELYAESDKLTPVINPAFLTGVFAIGSCIAIVHLLKKDSDTRVVYGVTLNMPLYSKILQIVTLLLVYFSGIIELNYQSWYYLESGNAVYTLLVIYHLLLSIIFIHTYSVGKSVKMQKYGSILGAVNIILFILVFSRYAYYEVENYLLMIIKSKAGYWLHFAALAAVIYSVILVFKINKEAVLQFLKNKGVKPWIAAFLLIYLASSELMLHWLVISLQPVKAGYTANGGPYTDAYESINIMRNQVVKTGYPILWGIIAFCLLLLGIKKQLKNVRVAALVLLGLTIAKLFIYDIRNASETGKIIAFILLGVLILVISFVYQKLKLLVIADKPAEPTNENKTNDEII